MNNRRVRQAVLVLADVGVIVAAFFLAFYMRFEGDIPQALVTTMPHILPAVLAVRLVTFWLTSLYRHLWRYASALELVKITGSVALGSILFYGIGLLTPIMQVPRSIYFIEFLLVLCGVGFIRFVMRLRRSVVLQRDAATKIKRALIYGAGEAGSHLAIEFKSQPELGVQVVGFVDDDPLKARSIVHGVPVLGTRTELDDLVVRKRVHQIIIAMPAVPEHTVRQVIDVAKKTKAELKILPPIDDILNGQVGVQHIRDVRIEDLLRREPVKTDLTAISGYLAGRRVLVTGAGGSIGSELCRQIASFTPKQLILLGHGENSIFDIHNELKGSYPNLPYVTVIADIRDQDRIDRVFAEHKPEVVFHAAAHKHVPLMEANPAEAVTNNVFGTRNVAKAADKHGSECFVMISTDKAVKPGNVMGATKRVAEMVVQSLARQSATRFVSVRFGNVLGSRGSVIPFFTKQIAQGGPVTVTHPDMKRYFMTIPEAAQLVIQAGALGLGGEIFLLDMGEPVRIVDLAWDLIRLSGFEPNKDIQVVFTGTRPGEKLFEELINADEAISKTRHEKIMQLHGEGLPAKELEGRLTVLKQHLETKNTQGLVNALYSLTDAKPAQPMAAGGTASGGHDAVSEVAAAGDSM